jgi:hypothetical protein
MGSFRAGISHKWRSDCVYACIIICIIVYRSSFVGDPYGFVPRRSVLRGDAFCD